MSAGNALTKDNFLKGKLKKFFILYKQVNLFEFLNLIVNFFFFFYEIRIDDEKRNTHGRIDS
jgi:hypothetical protein